MSQKLSRQTDIFHVTSLAKVSIITSCFLGWNKLQKKCNFHDIFAPYWQADNLSILYCPFDELCAMNSKLPLSNLCKTNPTFYCNNFFSAPIYEPRKKEFAFIIKPLKFVFLSLSLSLKLLHCSSIISFSFFFVHQYSMRTLKLQIGTPTNYLENEFWTTYPVSNRANK